MLGRRLSGQVVGKEETGASMTIRVTLPDAQRGAAILANGLGYWNGSELQTDRR